NAGGGGGGMRFHFGTGAPDASLGAPGDVYLNTSNGDFYLNQNGTWNQIGNLRGPQGPQGPEGDQGPAGAGIDDITSDGENITFHLTAGTTRVIPWPTQGGECSWPTSTPNTTTTSIGERMSGRSSSGMPSAPAT